MQITFRQDELTFVFDKYTRVKSIIPRGECEFTVVFERISEEITPSVHEKLYEKHDVAPAQMPIKENNTQEHNQQKIIENEIENAIENEVENENECPTVDDVVEFIKSININYTHDNALIQMHFLGRLLYSRDDPNLYHKLKTIVGKARDKIAIDEHGKWKDKGFRNLSNTRRSKQFTFVKTKVIPTENTQDKNEVQLKDVMTKLSNEIKRDLLTIEEVNKNSH
jgi:hypothetical protein